MAGYPAIGGRQYTVTGHTKIKFGCSFPVFFKLHRPVTGSSGAALKPGYGFHFKLFIFLNGHYSGRKDYSIRRSCICLALLAAAISSE
jgi:hypothetical protein